MEGDREGEYNSMSWLEGLKKEGRKEGREDISVRGKVGREEGGGGREEEREGRRRKG